MFPKIRRSALLSVSFLLFSLMQIQPVFADGELDTSFGNGGTVSFTDPRFSEYSINRIIFQGDKILIAGTIYGHYEAPIPRAQQTFFARFLPDGNLDESFGNNPELEEWARQFDPDLEVYGGGFTALFQLGIGMTMRDVILSDQGNILTISNGDQGIEIFSFSPDGEVPMLENGEPDKDGVLFFHSGQYPQFPEGAIVHSAETQRDGKILLVGNIEDSPGGFIARLNQDGSLDSGFSEDGIEELTVGESNSIRGLTPLADGGVAVGGRFHRTDINRYAGYIAKFTKEGRPDLTFGDNGLQTLIDVSGNSFRGIQCSQDGGIFTAWDYIAGFNFTTYSIVKSNSTGQLDMSFSDDGFIDRRSGLTDSTRGFGVLNGDNMITLITKFHTPYLTRFDNTGAYDPEMITTAISSESLPNARMRIRSDGNIFVLTERPKGEQDASFQLLSIKNSIPPLRSDFSQCGEINLADDVFKNGFEGAP